jgi:hypothetical protein
MTCAGANCHASGGNNPPGNPLTLQNDNNLYTNVTTHISALCGNIPVVNPGKPDASALIMVLQTGCGDPNDGGIPRMPYECSGDCCIPDAYIAALQQWIANGAPQQ